MVNCETGTPPVRRPFFLFPGLLTWGLTVGVALWMSFGCGGKDQVAGDVFESMEEDWRPESGTAYSSNVLEGTEDLQYDWVGLDDEGNPVDERDISSSDSAEFSPPPVEGPKELPDAQSPEPGSFPVLPDTVGKPDPGANRSFASSGSLEWGDIRIDGEKIRPQVSPYLTETVAAEFVDSVFEDIENRNEEGFFRKVAAPDVREIWEKATRVSGRWRVETRVLDPQTVEVDAEFEADRADGLFRHTYTLRVVWDGGWRITDWRR